MPADDSKTKLDSRPQFRGIEPATGVPGDSDKACCPGIGSNDDPEKPFDLAEITHNFRERIYIMASEADSNRLALDKIQLPLPTAWRQQRRAITHVAHRLAICLAGLAPSQEKQHEPAAKRSGEWKTKHPAHGYIDEGHYADLDTPFQRALRW